MNSLVESLGLLCLAIDQGGENNVGRTKLQKMIYFADRYMDWDVGDYQLHYYGPYSQSVASVLKTARNDLLDERKPGLGPYQYSITDEGVAFMTSFVKSIDDERMEKTSDLFQELAAWSKEELELAATIDYVNKNIHDINRDELINKVSIIKENFSMESIEAAYQKWLNWKQNHNF